MVNEVNGLTSTSAGNTQVSDASDAVSADNQQRTAGAINPGGDSFEISDEAKLLSNVQAQVLNLPEVDQKRVDSLREAINSGQYRVDSSELAQDIINFEG